MKILAKYSTVEETWVTDYKSIQVLNTRLVTKPQVLSVSKVTLHRLHEISLERQRVLLMLLPREQWGWGVGSGLVWRECMLLKVCSQAVSNRVVI